VRIEDVEGLVLVPDALKQRAKLFDACHVTDLGRRRSAVPGDRVNRRLRRGTVPVDDHDRRAQLSPQGREDRRKALG